jgi:flagellar biosynthesis/type III secretory pathway chaperone
MTTFKEELEDVLKRELSVMEKILKVSQEKTDAIVDSNLKKLEEITKEEEVLLNKVASLEDEREELLNTWGLDTKLPLSEIIENIPEEDKSLLYEIKEKLITILEELREKNDLNNALIQDSLEFINFTLNAMASVESPATYEKDKLKDSRVKSIFDRKV